MEKDNRTVVDSVAAKKKAKKEKEKQKKEETETKMAGKKVPAHVRKMQEELARHKEAEEKRKREEEERRMKEEEEERKREEISRQKEEERMRKKEKEKEKIRRRKEAGLPLTRKQKEEAHRREIMRNQILAANGHNLVVNENDGQKRRPVYSTKKSMNKTNVVQKKEAKSEAVVDQGECISAEGESNDEEWGAADQGESVSSDDNKNNGVGEEESDGDQWDAKSWDDSAIHLSAKQAFDDEDEDQNGSMSQLADQKQVQSPAPRKFLTSDCNEKDPVSETEVQKESSSSAINLRSPICCVMGHVDAGKTKLLDCIRGTNIQEGEAGGITQQIGATYFPAGKIKERTRESKAEHAELNVPGLLVIDTPGHESFTNLRSRGSGLCDVAILVVDIMDGLKPQTIESIDLLKRGNIDFIVALNKVDRLYGWKTCRNAPIKKAMKQQTKDVLNEFNDRLVKIIAQFQKQDLNTELYYKNKKMGQTFSIVPTSAVSGEGIPDLLLLLVKWSERTMVEKLTFSNKVQCTVLEVKVVEGHGTTIDVVLINGVLREGDQIVVCGIQEPIVTTIRALLTPHPMKELRVKGTYQRHKEIKASQGIKIAAQGLEHVIAGADMYVVGPDDDVKDLKNLAMNEEDSVLSRIEMSGEGVCVQASSFGSAEALVKFLKSQDIPVRYINRGPVHKKDVKQAIIMLEKKKEYATILAFDVEITPEAREYADGAGVKIFTADVIYHLFDQFKAYINEIKEKRKREAADDAVFPCILKILPSHIYNQKAPILVGVKVLKGIVKVGTPIFIPSKNFMDIGRVTSIQLNGKPVDLAKEDQEATVKIVGSTAEEQRIVYGRHFDYNNKLYSHITRKSIDAFEAVYKDDECISGIRDLLSKMEMKLRIT